MRALGIRDRDITIVEVISYPEMIRTLISLDRESQEWLDRQAEVEKVSTAELIRTAVRRYREERSEKPFL